MSPHDDMIRRAIDGAKESVPATRADLLRVVRLLHAVAEDAANAAHGSVNTESFRETIRSIEATLDDWSLNP